MTECLDQDTIQAALELAVRAPSIHNTQPWRFRVGRTAIELHAEPLRQTDVTERDRLISCGAALHHLRVALAGLGRLPVTDRLPDPGRPEHLATIETSPRATTHAELALAVTIPRRRSDRRCYGPRPVPEDCLAELTRLAAAESVRLCVVHGETRAQLMRWTGADDALRRFAPCPQRPVESEEDGAGTLVVLGTEADDRLSRLRAGEATSAVLLAATRMGLATCPLTRPPEIPASRVREADVVPQVVLRIGWPPEQPNPFPITSRRPTADVTELL